MKDKLETLCIYILAVSSISVFISLSLMAIALVIDIILKTIGGM